MRFGKFLPCCENSAEGGASWITLLQANKGESGPALSGDEDDSPAVTGQPLAEQGRIAGDQASQCEVLKRIGMCFGSRIRAYA